jgi:hypothetical protein
VLYVSIFTGNGLAYIGGGTCSKNQKIINGVIGGKDFGVVHHYILMVCGGIQAGVPQI